MENRDIIKELNDLSSAILVEKAKLIEEMKLPFEVVEKMNYSINLILREYLYQPKISINDKK